MERSRSCSSAGRSSANFRNDSRTGADKSGGLEVVFCGADSTAALFVPLSGFVEIFDFATTIHPLSEF
jgi:hypothetical protein